MFINFEIEFLFFVELILLLIFLRAVFINFKLFFKFDFNSFSQQQFQLEQESYLQKSIIYLIFVALFSLLIFYIFTLDSLSFKIKGAMCASGIINSNKFGYLTLVTKLISLFLISLWIAIDFWESKNKNYPYIKLKLNIFFIFALFFILSQIFLTLFFVELAKATLVQCCSISYGGSKELIFGFDYKLYLLVFAISFFGTFSKNGYVTLIFETIFFITSLLLITNLFSTYIYELPTHKCPYCMLKSEYHYIGYPIYLTLLTSTIVGFIYSISEIFGVKEKHNYKIKLYSITIKLIFVILILYFPLSYYIRHGVWL